MRKALFLLLLLPITLFAQRKYSESFHKQTEDILAIAYCEGAQSLSTTEKESNPPVADLLNFRYECGHIKWSTASETNCSHFLIMFSRDNKSWNILGQIYGAGNSSAMNNYKYPTDLKDVYFKIYQMDFNGSTKEFGPIYGTCKKT